MCEMENKIYLLLLIFLNAFLFSNGKMIKVLEFQESGVPSINSTAARFFTPEDIGVPSLSSYSICSWFRVSNYKSSSYSYIFSYAISDEKNNELNLGIAAGRLSIARNEDYLRSSSKTKFWPLTWFHVCVVSEASKHTTIFVNGEYDKRERVPEDAVIHLNGSFILGQETDKLNGGFSLYQSYSGKIAGLNFFSRVLTEDEVLVMSGCGEDILQGDVINWETDDWNRTGDVSQYYVPLESICQGSWKKKYKIFPHVADFKGAKKMCEIMTRSIIYTPLNLEENTELVSLSLPFHDQCKSKYHATGYLWTGIVQTNSNWTYSNGSVANFTNFQHNIDKKSQNCATIESSPRPGAWNDVKCGFHCFCYSCWEPETTVFYLRGLCFGESTDSISGKFIASDVADLETGKFRFKGFNRLEIFADTNNLWLLRDIWKNETLATYSYHDGHSLSVYPIGQRTWKSVNKDFFRCEENNFLGDNYPELTFSACTENEYTCADGSCIPLKKRCDLRVDCNDSSDERKCEKLIHDADYLRMLPPPSPVKEGEPLKIRISIQVNSIAEIDHVNMAITVDMTFTFRWYDLRLRYKNLKDTTTLNYIPSGNVWNPSIECLEADFAEIRKSVPNLEVIKKSLPNVDKIIRPVRDEMFDGSSNPLILKQRMKAKVACHMDLTNFPFDIQTCWINIKEGHQASLVRWDNVEVTYTGKEILTEFVIGKMKSELHNTEKQSIASVRIQLFRRFSYYLNSAYFPSILLIIISYFSLFCKIQNVDLRVMMTITILVVLYTLYQQLAAGLPKTAYSKAIDVWCNFALFIIFAQVVFHVFLEIEIEFFYNSTRRLEGFFKNKEIDPKIKNKNFCLFLSRFFFAFLFVAFMVGYCIAVSEEYYRLMTLNNTLVISNYS